MARKEKEVEDEVLQMIETHSVSKDDYLIFDIEKLSNAWGKNHHGRFSNLGQGKFSTFLVDVCGAERLDGPFYRIKKWKEERRPRRRKKPKASSQNDNAAAQEESKGDEAGNLAPCLPTGADLEVSSSAEACAASFPEAGASKEQGKPFFSLIYCFILISIEVQHLFQIACITSG